MHHGGDGRWSTGRGGCAEVSHSSSLHLPLKTKLLGKLRVEARRHAAKRLADRHVRLTDCFSRAATGVVSWCFEPSQAQRVISGLILTQKKKSAPMVSRGLGRTLPLTVPVSGFPLVVVKMTGAQLMPQRF